MQWDQCLDRDRVSLHVVQTLRSGLYQPSLQVLRPHPTAASASLEDVAELLLLMFKACLNGLDLSKFAVLF